LPATPLPTHGYATVVYTYICVRMYNLRVLTLSRSARTRFIIRRNNIFRRCNPDGVVYENLYIFLPFSPSPPPFFASGTAVRLGAQTRGYPRVPRPDNKADGARDGVLRMHCVEKIKNKSCGVGRSGSNSKQQQYSRCNSGGNSGSDSTENISRG